jgi:spermidine synthase
MTLWLVGVGLVTLLGQVVLLRELLVAFYGSELVYILALGFLMVVTAAGVAAGARLPKASPAQVRALFAAIALALPLLVAATRSLRLLFGGTPGAYLSFGQQLIGLVLSLSPFGFLGGLLFHRAAALYIDGGGTLARAYAVESAGGLAGGALATLFLAWGVQNLTAAIAGALASLILASLPWRTERPRWKIASAGGMAVFLFAALFYSGDLDRALTRLNHPHLAATLDTPYGRATVTRRLGQVALFENDALVFESQGTSAEEFVHAVALASSSPQSFLIFGGAAEGLIREALQHHPARVVDVELNGPFLKLVTPLLPLSEQRAMNAEPVHIKVGDPRVVLERTGRYDVILSAMAEPDSGQANRFYTREFFLSCREHLNPGGVLGFRLRSSENLWTPALTRRTASIHGALRSVFRHTLVLPGTTNVIIASDTPLTRDPEMLAARWRDRGITARYVTPEFFRYLLTNDRLSEIEGKLAAAGGEINSDAKPVCYRYTQILWLSRFFPAVGMAHGRDRGPGTEWPWMAAAASVLLALVLICRRIAAWREILLVTLAGFLGMVLEGALILGYQVRRGVLFQDIGLLLTMFMAGLALGSFALHRWRSRWAGLLASGLAAAASLLAAWHFESGLWPSLVGTSLLLAMAGTAVGGLFAYASLAGKRDQASLISPLYSADLLGGATGSLAASLLLLPVLGLAPSAVLTAAAAVLCALLV